jgi:hypothetical protein
MREFLKIVPPFGQGSCQLLSEEALFSPPPPPSLSTFISFSKTPISAHISPFLHQT